MTRLARYDSRQIRDRGLRAIVGVDEVGRGCLAGPVVAAAVILPPKPGLPGVDDSKRLTREQRQDQADAIRRVALAIGFAFVGPRVIDAFNIRSASLLAMRRAIRRAGVRHRPGGGDAGILVLVDGLDVVPGVALEQQAIVGGDGTSLSIAAASIVAKTVRDRFMIRLAAEWPDYGFERHVGYGTEEHLEALARVGPCRWHRFSFSPVAQPDLFDLAASPL